jgi:hypothetical protein
MWPDTAMDRITLIGCCAAVLTAAILYMVWVLASDQAAVTLSPQ